MIRVHCPHCQYCLYAPDASAGATVACPDCRQSIRLPGSPPPLLTSAPRQPPAAAQTNPSQPLPPTKGSIVKRLPLWAWVVLLAGVLPFTLLFACGGVALVAVALLKPGAVDSNSGTAEKHGVEPTYAEAETVKRHVLENAHDPASVEFVTWYPRLEGTGEPYRR